MAPLLLPIVTMLTRMALGTDNSGAEYNFTELMGQSTPDVLPVFFV